MKPSCFYSAVIIMFGINTVYAQSDSLQRTLRVMQHLKEAVSEYDPCHYKAQMRFKEMGGDTFEIRNFDISYRSNASNPLYGYDWEIAEEVAGGYTYTFMILPEEIYAIFEGNKGIGKSQLPQTLDQGSYTEYIRSFFILNEVYSPFFNVPSDEIVFRQDGDYFHLTRQMNDHSTRELLVTRDTYLPVQSISMIRDEQFDFAQITEINFYTDEHIKSLPDTAFTIDHYLSLGYTLHQKGESAEAIVIPTVAPDYQELLLYYPLVTAAGDTTSLMASEAGYILLDFWYASCAPCLQAMPEVNKFQELYAKDGLQVIGINCFDKDISNNLAKRFKEKSITMPLYFASRDLVDGLGINSFPSYILITPDRHIQFINGYVEDVRKALSGIFDK